MSNNKIKKHIIPQRVFDLRTALVRDFFRVYECSLDELEVLNLGSWEPDYPATPPQMAKVLVMCKTIWFNYISKYSLPKSLYRTLEYKIKQEWQHIDNQNIKNMYENQRENIQMKMEQMEMEKRIKTKSLLKILKYHLKQILN